MLTYEGRHLLGREDGGAVDCGDDVAYQKGACGGHFLENVHHEHPVTGELISQVAEGDQPGRLL